MPVDAGSIFSEVRIRLDKLTGDVKQIDSLFDQINKGSEKTGKKTQEMSFLAVAAFAAVGLAIKKMVTSAVSLYADLEQSMANVASVAKATPEQFEKLEDAARAMGETTRFTASQAADALYYLASAGFDADKSVAALQGVLELAGATQSDLAFTSEAVASAISQFSLKASDSTRVANVFTAAITNSQATMDKLATSLRYVGPVASAFGYTIEDVAGVLQILYNNGFEASMAGTALRSALADLSNATSPAIDKLTALGVSFDEVNPATNSFASIVGLLHDRVSDAGDIMAIFGDRAGPAMIKLIQGGREEIEKYTKAVTGTNAASVAYARQNDTLAGSIDEMKSAAEESAISFSEIFAPAIRAIVDLLTKAISFINKMPPSLKVLTVGLGLVVPAVLAISVALKALIPTIIQVGGLMTGLFAPVVAITAGIVALGAGAYALKKHLDAVDLRKVKLEYGDLAEQLEITAEEMQNLVKAQRHIGEVTPETLTALNELRVSLGLTAEEFRKLVAQADRWNVTAEAFVLAKTQMGLTTLETKKLDNALKFVNDRTKNFDSVSDQVKSIAEQMSITVDQVVDFGLASEVVTDEYKEQLENIKAHAVEQAKLKSDYTAYAEGRLAATQAQIEKEKEITDELNNQALEKERLKNIDKTSRELNQKAIDDALYLQAQYNAGLITEKEYLEQNVSAQQKMYFALLDIFNINEKLDAIKYPGNYPGVIALLNAWNAAKAALNEYTGEVQESTEEVTAAYVKELSSIEGADEAYKKYREEQQKEDEASQKSLEEYNEKLRALTDETYNAIEAERERALVGVETGSQLYDAINKYYDALRDKTAVEEMIDNLKSATDTIRGFFSDLFSSLGDLAEANADKQLAEIDRQLQAALEAAGVQEQTAIEKAKIEYDAAVAAGDAELAAEKLREIQRLQITDEFEKKKKQIEYKAELLSWKYKMAGLLANAAGAVVKNFLDLGFIGGAIANALMAIPIGIQAAALSAQKPVPPAFDTGGLVIPSGGSGRNITVAENGYPELMMNSGPEGRPFMEEFANILANKINGGGGKRTITVIFEDAGRRIAESTAAYYNNGIVRVKLK